MSRLITTSVEAAPKAARARPASILMSRSAVHAARVVNENQTPISIVRTTAAATNVRVAAEALGGWLGPHGRPQLVPAAWKRRGDSEAIFLNQRGARLARQVAWAVVKKYGERAGLPPTALSPHVLRHSCATLLYELGVPIENIQDVLGHSTPVITKLLYVDGTEKMQRAAADRLGSLFEGLDE